MKVLQVNQQDTGSGGFIAAYRLHCALRAEGVDSKMLVLSKCTNDPDVIPLISPTLAAKVFWRVLGTINSRKLGKYKQKACYGWTASDIHTWAASKINAMSPHVVNFHLFDCVMAYSDVKKIKAHKVWTFHDMGAFTGGCHCTSLCTKYRQKCGRCPELASESDNDISAHGWNTKNALWHDNRIVGVAPSKWMQNEATSASVCRNNRVEWIPNGVPTHIFTPQIRSEARTEFGFGNNEFCILAGSSSLATPLKGFSFVIDAFRQLHAVYGNRIRLVTFGRSQPCMTDLPIKHLGYLSGDEALARAYASADAYVLPSLLDNLPNMLIESISCGTPGVTFDIGGCCDIIRDNVTGVVVRDHSAAAIAAALKKLIETPKDVMDLLRASSRSVAVTEYDSSIMAKRYLALYKNLGD